MGKKITQRFKYRQYLGWNRGPCSCKAKILTIIKNAKSFTNQVAHGAGPIPSFYSVKRMRVFDSPWMGH